MTRISMKEVEAAWDRYIAQVNEQGSRSRAALDAKWDYVLISQRYESLSDAVLDAKAGGW